LQKKIKNQILLSLEVFSFPQTLFVVTLAEIANELSLANMPAA
jgi:hypothetical protein